VDVETAGRHTYGRTVVDFAGKSGAEPNADVVIEVDVQAVHDALVAAIGILASTGEGALR
jgi:inosine-uridine nucleoside N-ribohydrolase